MEFDPNVVRRLQGVPGNRNCADCGEPEPEWASINLGVVICMNCSSQHRSMGTHISQVRSLKLDNWKGELLDRMENLGNQKVNAQLELHVPKFIPRPSEYFESDVVRKRFIKMKYEEKAFAIKVDDEEERHRFCQKEGHLLKQGKKDSSKWQKRWCVLSEGALAYYRGSDSQIPKGVVHLGSCAIFGIPTGQELTITAGPGQREYRFRSVNQDEIIEWLVALRASRSADGRGSIVRRALGSMVDGDGNNDDGTDEKPPKSEELSREAFRVLGDGHSIKQGWLLKRSARGVMHLWSKRYFVVIPEGAIYYFKSGFSVGKWKDPMGAMSIVGANIEYSTQRPFAIAIRCPEGQLLLSAENEEDRTSWVNALKTAADAHISPAN